MIRARSTRLGRFVHRLLHGHDPEYHYVIGYGPPVEHRICMRCLK
jgi:hypothetical protein